MDKSYWENISESYNEEIFDVLAHDTGRVIEKAIQGSSDRKATAADFGCGIGKALPLLSRHFASVEGFDLSSGNIRVASRVASGLSNVRVQVADLARGMPVRRKFDRILCVNVIMTEDETVRDGIWRTLRSSLATEGLAWLVVPALESIFLSAERLVEWHRREGATAVQARRKVKRALRERFESGIEAGLVGIDGVATKHYTAEELEALALRFGLELVGLPKVEYGWETEYREPPSWMRRPYPWDWLVVLRKGRVHGEGRTARPGRRE